MGLGRVYGHQALSSRLEGAIASGRFPQAALFVGPVGVGKQRLALWVAQGLLCEHGPARPCGTCRPCRQVTELTHPDLHWLIPLARRRSGDADQQIEDVEEGLAEVLRERREAPHYRPPEPQASHALASVRLLQRRITLTPFQGARKVVILGDAERLVVQDSSPEAANALLKVLEEPPADTTVILTASDPQRLLPTIRSRCVPVRVRPITDEAVRDFLANELAPPLGERERNRVAQLAGGCIGRALVAAEATNVADRAAARLAGGVRSGPWAWAAEALAQPPWGARGSFTELLDALAARLREELGEAVERGQEVTQRLDALRRVEEHRAIAQQNVNPQLALAVLAAEMEGLL